ncbi:RES family NAD+ phosphorylase [Riemerella columbina]|uniref:RES family NAD+ phosphorylase n=1 Tax=Riemerella columbina TaxID=103810 RepID=UPI0003A47C67|nr:RES family NAD+ phosphorylase [Riemerella columbina]
MLAFRIVHRKYANTLFASGMEGRWNLEGRKVLYTAESVALAYLETMYYRRGLGYDKDFKIMVIEVPNNASILQIEDSKLPKDWRDFRNYSACQELGEDWFSKGENLILKVPSAVVVNNYNLVLNTLHPDYQKVKLIDTLDFKPDARLEEILKKYEAK